MDAGVGEACCRRAAEAERDAAEGAEDGDGKAGDAGLRKELADVPESPPFAEAEEA